MTDVIGPADAGDVTAAPPVLDESRVAHEQRRWWREFLRDRVALGALVFLLLLALAALLASMIAPHGPNTNNLTRVLEGPSSDHLLGTDAFGRDVLSRLLFASRTALLAGLEAVVIGLVLGVPIGLAVGYVGGWWDDIVMRVVDALMAVPGLIVAFAIIAVLGPGLVNAMLAVGIIFAIRLIRLVRGLVLSTREELYVDAARLSGTPTRWVLARTIFPNILGPIIVQAALYFSAALLIEAMLSFLGIGVQRPQATWGTMLNEAREDQHNQPFLPFPPGIALTLTVLAFNLVGDSIRRSLGTTNSGPGPRRRRRPVPPAGTGDGDIVERDDRAASLLSVRELTVTVGSGPSALTALRSIDLDLDRGEMLGLVGESGSGKSLTALSVIGLLGPGLDLQRGSIQLAGEELVGRPESLMRTIRGKRMSMIFQEPIASLNPALTVGAQISETLRIHERLSRKEAHERSIELLDRVMVPNAAERVNDHPHRFSGGMAQRVMIAMALACDPELLIADEPTTALDVTTQSEVMDLLRSLVDDLGIGVLLITHDVALVAEYCDRTAVMYGGEIVESGRVDEMLRQPLHPYTAALLASIPSGSDHPDGLPTIPGRVPNLSELGNYCSFLNRCPHAIAACGAARPDLRAVASTRAVRCVRADELDLDGVR